MGVEILEVFDGGGLIYPKSSNVAQSFYDIVCKLRSKNYQ